MPVNASIAIMMANTGSQLPVASCRQRRDRTAEHRADALRHVQEAVIGGGVFGAERIGQRRGKQREDLAPAEKHHARQERRTTARCRATAPSAATAQPPSGRRWPSCSRGRCWSDTQPKNGRVRPLVMRSTVSASGNAAMPKTMTLATPKSREKVANCEMIISPPVDIMVIMTNISQNTLRLQHLFGGVTSPRRDGHRRGGGSTSPAAACAGRAPRRRRSTPRMMPNTTSVCW